jgi:hypothetical protein
MIRPAPFFFCYSKKKCASGALRLILLIHALQLLEIHKVFLRSCAFA